MSELESIGIELDRFELLHVKARLKLESELAGEGDDFLFQIEQQLKRNVKEVAAAAGRVEHGDAGELIVKDRQPLAMARTAFALYKRGGELAFELAPLAP